MTYYYVHDPFNKNTLYYHHPPVSDDAGKAGGTRHPPLYYLLERGEMPSLCSSAAALHANVIHSKPRLSNAASLPMPVASIPSHLRFPMFVCPDLLLNNTQQEQHFFSTCSTTSHLDLNTTRKPIKTMHARTS